MMRVRFVKDWLDYYRKDTETELPSLYALELEKKCIVERLDRENSRHSRKRTKNEVSSTLQKSRH